MSLLAPLWLQNQPSPYYPASADRRLITALWSPGVLAHGDLKVSQRAAGANISVDVAAGRCVVEGTDTTGQGHYLCESTDTVNVALDAVPGSGQKRIDLIVAQIADSSVTGSDDEWTIDAVTGTPSVGEPATPATPASSLVLAEVTVTGAAASILDKDITDRRVQAGSPITAGSPSIRPTFDGQIMATADGVVYVATSGEWEAVNAAPPPRPRFYSASKSSWTPSTSTSTVCAVTVPAPGWPCRITASGQANAVLDESGGFGSIAEHWVTIGGTSGAVHTSYRATTPAPMASTSSSGLSPVSVQLLTRKTGPSDWTGTNAQLLVRVDPIDP